MVAGPPSKVYSQVGARRSEAIRRPRSTVHRKSRQLNDLNANSAVTRNDVLAAAERISQSVLSTELREVRLAGDPLWLKCESLQTGGAFKLRGASNRLAQLTAAERARGVVAFSSGNHALGVAIAARRLGIAATIVMPSDAPALKIDGTRAEGAEIIFFDRLTEDRAAIATPKAWLPEEKATTPRARSAAVS